MKKLSIKKEVFYLSLISFFLIFLILGFAVVKPDFDDAIRQTKRTLEYENNRINTYFTEAFYEANTTLEALAENEDVKNAMELDESGRKRVLDFYNLLTVSDDIIGHVYSAYEDGTIIISEFDFPKDVDPTKRPWYKAAIESEESSRTVYRDLITGEHLFSNGRPLKESNSQRKIGVLAVDISNKKLYEVLGKSYMYNTQRSYVVNEENIIMLHQDKRLIGKDWREKSEQISRNGFTKREGQLEYMFDSKEVWAHYKKIEGTDLYSVTAIDSSEVLGPLVKKTFKIILIVLAISLSIWKFQNKLLENRVLRPFRELSSSIHLIAEGKREYFKRYSFKNQDLINIASDIETIAQKSIEDKENRIKVSELKYKSLIDNLGKDYFIYILDLNREVEYISPSVLDMLGFFPEEIKAKDTFNEFIDRKELKDLENERKESLIFEATLLDKKNREKSLEITEILLKDSKGNKIGIEGVVKDVTEKKEKQKEIEYLSFYDAMTGLYNRRFFEAELKRLDVERNYPLSILYGDVNGLKLANDIFGHSVGDELIRRVAKSIKDECRKDDIIARVGGDEFAIIFPHAEGSQVEKIVKRIKSRLAKENIGQLYVSASFGWATKNKSGEPIEDIIKKADEAMYNKKLTESPKMRKLTVGLVMEKALESGIVKEKLEKIEAETLEKMSKAFNLSKHDAASLIDSYRYRNIGKTLLSDEILAKSGKLSDEDWNSIKRHPEIGYRILSASPEYSELAEYVLAHHERWDGSGYPKGLKREEIPLISRIIPVLDSYMAMKEKKTYRKEKNILEIMKEINGSKGSQFDPEIVRVFFL